jgi:hypothetical protein
MSVKQNGTELKSTVRSALLKKFQGTFSERPIEPIEVEPSILRRWTRRDLLLFGAGALVTLTVGGSQLPRQVLQRLGLDQGGTTGPENKWLLNKALRLDDDLSTTLYSQHHLVPTGLIPEKWTVEKCSSAQVKGAEGNEEKSVQ